MTHLTNASGNVIEKYKYDAFGAMTIYNGGGVQIRSTAYNNRFLFTGREYAATYAGTYTPAFNFYEYRARAYNPTLGRFMSEDPKGFVRRVGLGTSPSDWSFGAHPDEAELNLFRYCGNDPLNRIDPMGEEGWTDYPRVVWALSFNRDSIDKVRQIQKDAGAAGQKAAQEARAKGTITDTRDITNAIRHVVGSAELTRAVGAGKAKEITDIHEDGAKDKRDSLVDQYHNKIGREIGAAAKNETDLRTKVEEALKSGKLILNQDKDRRIPTELQKK